jgi:ABC-type lipoprotein export system ATPase subunit
MPSGTSAGKLVLLIGPSGVGKSVILKHPAAIQDPFGNGGTQQTSTCAIPGIQGALLRRTRATQTPTHEGMLILMPTW